MGLNTKKLKRYLEASNRYQPAHSFNIWNVSDAQEAFKIRINCQGFHRVSKNLGILQNIEDSGKVVQLRI